MNTARNLCLLRKTNKKPDFYPTMKDFYILGREDLPFLPEVEHVGYFAHVTYERSYAARAATLPRVPALVITPSVAASRNTAQW